MHTVEYRNQTFTRVLIALLTVLIVVNVLTFVWTGLLFVLVPIALQGVVLWALRKKWRYTRTIVRVWAAVLILAGATAAFATVLRLIDFAAFGTTEALQEINVASLIFRLALLGGGLYIFIMSKRYIVPAGSEEEPAMETVHAAS